VKLLQISYYSRRLKMESKRQQARGLDILSFTKTSMSTQEKTDPLVDACELVLAFLERRTVLMAKD
jgi:hypothetical protein